IRNSITNLSPQDTKNPATLGQWDHPRPGLPIWMVAPPCLIQSLTVTFTKPLLLPADHYFFVPQVLASDPNVHFLWLSAPRPIVFGTPFNTDLQAWIRNADLEPDWLRVGTDIVGGGVTFNASFTLSGSLPTVYEYDFYKAGTTTVAAALVFPGLLRD